MLLEKILSRLAQTKSLNALVLVFSLSSLFLLCGTLETIYPKNCMHSMIVQIIFSRHVMWMVVSCAYVSECLFVYLFFCVCQSIVCYMGENRLMPWWSCECCEIAVIASTKTTTKHFQSMYKTTDCQPLLDGQKPLSLLKLGLGF